MDINTLLSDDLRSMGWRISSIQFKEESGELRRGGDYEPSRVEIILTRNLPVVVNAKANQWGHVVVVASGKGVCVDDAMLEIVSKIYNGTPKPDHISLELDKS